MNPNKIAHRELWPQTESEWPLLRRQSGAVPLPALSSQRKRGLIQETELQGCSTKGLVYNSGAQWPEQLWLCG